MKNAQCLQRVLLCALLLPLAAAHAATMDATEPSGNGRGDRQRTLVNKARAVYAEDMARCTALAGSDRAVCIKEAQAVQAESLAAARKGMEVGDEVPPPSAGMREAEHRMALQKCDSLMGDERRTCMAAVNAQFGQY